MEPYERFEAWKRADECVLAVYAATRSWPVEERYGLTAEIRRAARSVPTNIVEGSAKFGNAEFRRFLDIGLGSIAEVGYLLRLAKSLGILSTEEWKKVELLRKDAARLLWLLYRSLGPRHPGARR